MPRRYLLQSNTIARIFTSTRLGNVGMRHPARGDQSCDRVITQAQHPACRLRISVAKWFECSPGSPLQESCRNRTLAKSSVDQDLTHLGLLAAPREPRIA